MLRFTSLSSFLAGETRVVSESGNIKRRVGRRSKAGSRQHTPAQTYHRPLQRPQTPPGSSKGDQIKGINSSKLHAVPAPNAALGHCQPVPPGSPDSSPPKPRSTGTGDPNTAWAQHHGRSRHSSCCSPMTPGTPELDGSGPCRVPAREREMGVNRS